MSLKPSDIFIGVIEFISVMLPGALLTYFLMGRFYTDVFGEDKIFAEPRSEAARWIVFLLTAYIVGNIVFMLAAFLDRFYDKVLRKRFFQSNHDLTYKMARAIHCRHVDTDKKLAELHARKKISKEEYEEILGEEKREIFNTYKWSQHFLAFKNPDALADIKRIEADSKFFRSLVVAFLIIACLLFVQAKIAAGVLFVAFAVLCFYRYGDFRRKATERAYETVITCYHLAPRNDREAKQTTSSADLKQNLTEDFLNRHGEQISFLTKGFNAELKQIIFSADDKPNQVFVSDKNESWCCLQGRGVLSFSNGGASFKTRVMPNAIISITKDCNFSFIHNGAERTEILVLES